MAVMSARSVARRLVNIQRLSTLYHGAVEEMRQDAVKTTVRALWQRYKMHQKREQPRSFVEWLAHKQYLESTFWHDTTGASLATRRQWANGYYNFLTRKELTLADDPDNLWIFDALESELDMKNLDPDWKIRVEIVSRDGLKDWGLQRREVKPGKSFVFSKIKRAWIN